MMKHASTAAPRRRPGAERLLKVASELFYQEGIRAIGVDTVSSEADVSKRTLYNRFGDKDGLVAAYLRCRDERWWAYLDEVTAETTAPRARLIALFEAYAAWLQAGHFRGCPFVNATAEIADPQHPARVIARRHKEKVGTYLEELARDLGCKHPDFAARSLFILLEGAIATAAMQASGEPFDTAQSTALILLEAQTP